MKTQRLASKEEQESLLVDKLKQITSNLLTINGFKVHMGTNPINNQLSVSYIREKKEGVRELNGFIQGNIVGTSFNLKRMTFDYTIKTEMNYFAGGERHNYRCTVGGTGITEPQLTSAFEGYISKIGLGHKEFFDKLQE
ncbi:MAG: hypothetical protein AABX29_00485 [Nanoarchaeota archaeon]